jgi:hypothetical protein
LFLDGRWYLLQVKSFTDIFKVLCASPNSELQFRALYIIRNIVKVNKELAIRIVETEIMEIVYAIKEMKEDGSVLEKVSGQIDPCE